jgi:tetratricopeptide (TPR) repeat protein
MASSSISSKQQLDELTKDKSVSPFTILQHISDHKLNEPSLVLNHGLPLRSKKKKMPTSQYLSLLEQLAIAALHSHNVQLGSEIVTEIKSYTGGNSLRYRKLLALCLESAGDIDDAVLIYDDMLSSNPSNTYALQRKYAILRSQLKDLEARQCLNAYLEENGMDAPAWVEMAKTCMEQGDYVGAAFCYEELILFSPMDTSVHCTLGELYVTIGGKENYILARKHFAQCLEFDKGYIRAMFGLVSASESYLDLMEKESGDKKKKKEWDQQDVELVRDLKAYGVQNLIKSYKGSTMGGLVETILSNESN